MASLPQAGIEVLATLGVQPALDRLVPRFERATGQRVTLAWPATVELIARIEAGAVADLVIAAAAAVDRLIAGGHLAAASRRDIARSGIAAAVRQGAPRPDISTPQAFAQALRQARSIAYSTGPSGAYLEGLIDRMGLAEVVARKLTVSRSGPVGALVASGEIELGFQQLQELLAVPGIDVVGPLPQAIQQTTTFAAACHAKTDAADAAMAFIAYLATEAAAAEIERTGMQAIRPGA